MSRTGQGGYRLALSLLLVCVALGIGGCRRKPKAAQPPLPPPVGETQTGLASWYGEPFHGRQTANGEVYDMNAMTAAHRTLPFNTWVRVVNLESDLYTTVRINDRGPFIEGRIIDLSRAAAEAIDMLGPGTALVRLETVQQPNGEPSALARYSVQVGAFLVEENARSLQAQLVARFGDVFIQAHQAPDGLYYRVRVGRKQTLGDALALAQELRRSPAVTAVFVVRLN
ncbi:MAG: septal ring lytic transglycosylase RlpA family protein [Terriglobia bacterium]